jgi:hypothetical protein
MHPERIGEIDAKTTLKPKMATGEKLEERRGAFDSLHAGRGAVVSLLAFAFTSGNLCCGLARRVLAVHLARARVIPADGLAFF